VRPRKLAELAADQEADDNLAEASSEGPTRSGSAD